MKNDLVKIVAAADQAVRDVNSADSSFNSRIEALLEAAFFLHVHGATVGLPTNIRSKLTCNDFVAKTKALLAS